MPNLDSRPTRHTGFAKLSLLSACVLLIQANHAYAAQTNTIAAKLGRGVSEILNTATADYQVDGDREQSFTATSNQVLTQAFSLPQYSIALTQPLSITIKPNTTVQWVNELTNTGSYDATVAVKFDTPQTLSNLQAYIDANNNGILDQGDTPLAPTVSLQAGEKIAIIVTALAAQDLKDGDTTQVGIQAMTQEDSNATASATDVAHIVEPIIHYKDRTYDNVMTQNQAGQPVYLEVGLALCNANPNAVDYTWINVTSQKTGDTIRLKAVETGANTGRYRVSAPTELNANAIQDTIIQTLDGDVLGAQASQCESADGSTTNILSNAIYASININNDISALSVSKTASVSEAEIGDFVDYTVNVSNVGKSDAVNVALNDDLPTGFRYVKNSVRVDGQRYDKDFSRNGKYMTLGLGTLAANESHKVTYRVAIEPTALSGDGTNKAFATGEDSQTLTAITSGTASAKVKVTGNPLTTDGVIIGKVYADFNRDGIQQKQRNELGVAGVRLYLEDGTFVVTDSEGKYSLYGISAKTHVIKLDRTTLPRGVELVEQSNRNAGDAGSRFVDLKHGELHRADFGITDGIDDNNGQGSQALVEELKRRAKLVIAKNDALEQAVKTTLEVEPSSSSYTNYEYEAEGCLKPIEADGQISCQAMIIDNQAGKRDRKTDNALAFDVNPIRPVQAPEIEKALSTADDKRIEGVTADADFLNLKDNQRVDSHKIRVQIKAPKGATTELLVNNTPVDQALMGKEVAWDKEGISGFDYYAVPLQRGSNALTVRATDSSGKVVSSKTIRIYAPDQIANIITREQTHVLEADGVSELQIAISLKDKDGGLYPGSATITLDSDIGTVLREDKDPNQAGVQTTIDGGEALISVRAPSAPGKGNLVIKAGDAERIIPLQFTPQLRPMIASGIIEGSVAFNNLGKSKHGTISDDGFEDELQRIAGDKGDDTTGNGRAAFFLKGKVRGDVLLTMAYDSDKDKNARLFRDIRPDDYYPVYGDASAKGFDAQSSKKFYVRLDKDRSFVMYGDLKTHIDNNDGLSLGQYDRTLTGIKSHYENDTTKVTAFVAQTRSSQRVNETRGLGISGPYPVGGNFDDVLLNSETVEVIVRDRNNPGRVISRTPLSRYSDYDLDSVSRALYLRAPIASTDLDGNPIYLRVSVEAEEAGDEYTVGGVAVNRQLTPKINVGASYAQSDDPTNNEKLTGANTVVKFNERTKLIAEVAHYDSDKLNDQIANQINASELQGKTAGDAVRAELTYKDKTRDGKLYYTQADIGFTSPSSSVTAGRTEAGLNLTNQINAKTKLKAEAVMSEDDTSNAERKGATLSLERKLSDIFTAELGLRYYDNDYRASRNYQAVVSTDIYNQSLTPSVSNTDSHYQGTTVRGRLTADLPKYNRSKLFVEYEQDVDDADRNAWSVGGETSLWNKGRLYARHELASTLVGDYGLDGNDEHRSTIIGVDANYMKDGQVFSEYRVKDGISARESEAAIGLRNKWKVQDGLYVNTSFERLQSLEGDSKNDATAATVGVDYLANDKYKLTTRTEKRWGVQTDTFLQTLGYANKINDDITLLAKDVYSLQEDNDSDKKRTMNRFQLGMAYRDYDSNILDHLAKLEYRYDNNQLGDSPYKKQTYIASLVSNYHPVRRWTLSGQYAGKYNKLTLDGIESDGFTNLLAGRAMYEINERWDAGVQAGAMWHKDNTRYLLGAEVGYSPITNLWLSAGYNFKGYHDDDIADSNTNQQGAYMRLRFKFDENLFKRNKPAVNASLMPTDDEVPTK